MLKTRINGEVSDMMLNITPLLDNSDLISTQVTLLSHMDLCSAFTFGTIDLYLRHVNFDGN
jgi:hypothetical protein